MLWSSCSSRLASPEALGASKGAGREDLRNQHYKITIDYGSLSKNTGMSWSCVFDSYQSFGPKFDR